MENFKVMQESEEIMRTSYAVTVTQPVGVGFGSIEAPDMDDAEAQELAEQIVERHLVAVSPDAAGCCIDGRTCVHRLDMSETTPGPKCAGGPLATAFAAAELTGWFDDRDFTVEEKLTELKDRLESQGIVIGAHCDTAALARKFEDDETGCGAVVKFVEIMRNIGMPETHDFIIGGTQLLMSSDTFVPERAEAVVRTAATQPVSSKEWSASRIIELVGDRKTEVLGGTQIKHAEVIVFSNNEEDTTGDRDAIQKEMGVQVFWLDTWYIRKSMRAIARGPHAQEQYETLVHAAIAFQLGTLVTLGSGNHRVAQVLPQEA